MDELLLSIMQHIAAAMPELSLVDEDYGQLETQEDTYPVTTLNGLSYKTFKSKQFDLVESLTSHNHEDILDNIEVYQCVAFRKLR